jgi:hypothetical protein
VKLLQVAGCAPAPGGGALGDCVRTAHAFAVRPVSCLQGAAGPMLAEPTSTQHEAFDLIGVSIPLTLT